MNGAIADELLQFNPATTKQMFEKISLENGETLTKVNQQHLQDIIQSEHLRNMPVSIVSVAGPFREGKSFLLNILRRYLLDLRKEQLRTGLWDVRPPPLRSEASFPDGFLSKGGVKSVTSGIEVLAEPIVVSTEDGDVAVILMDTEGSFDPQRQQSEGHNGMHNDGLIFALSVLLSDTQIFNTKGLLKETTLDELAMFLHYGSQANDSKTQPNADSADSPFNRLVFCLRDIGAIDEIDGESYLNQLLSSREDVKEKLSCYKELACHFLPHPGKPVVRNTATFRGLVGDVDSEFMELMWSMAASLFNPRTLRAKRVERALTCDLLPQLAVDCWKALQTKVAPMQTHIEAYANVKYIQEKDAAFRNYRQEMHERMTAWYDPNLVNEHSQCKTKALNAFDSAVGKIRYGSVHQKSSTIQNLGNDIEDEWQRLSATNRNKMSLLDTTGEMAGNLAEKIYTAVRNPIMQAATVGLAIAGAIVYVGTLPVASALLVAIGFARNVPM